MVAGLWVRWLGLLLTVMLLLAVVVTVVIVNIDETLTQAVTDQEAVMQEENQTLFSEWAIEQPSVANALSAGQSNRAGQAVKWGLLALLCFGLLRLCLAKLHQRWGKEVNKNREGHNHEP